MGISLLNSSFWHPLYIYKSVLYSFTYFQWNPSVYPHYEYYMSISKLDRFYIYMPISIATYCITITYTRSKAFWSLSCLFWHVLQAHINISHNVSMTDYTRLFFFLSWALRLLKRFIILLIYNKLCTKFKAKLNSL